MYSTIKCIHVSSVILSFTGFFIRGLLMIKGSELFYSRVTKIAPHIIDTILLITAITLVIMSAQYPTVFNWLSLKIIGLLFYIALGMFAFRFGKNQKIKIFFWIGAQIIFILIVFAALFKPLS